MKLKNTGELPAADGLFRVLSCPLLANFGSVKHRSFVLPLVFVEKQETGEKASQQYLETKKTTIFLLNKL